MSVFDRIGHGLQDAVNTIHREFDGAKAGLENVARQAEGDLQNVGNQIQGDLNHAKDAVTNEVNHITEQAIANINHAVDQAEKKLKDAVVTVEHAFSEVGFPVALKACIEKIERYPACLPNAAWLELSAIKFRWGRYCIREVDEVEGLY